MSPVQTSTEAKTHGKALSADTLSPAMRQYVDQKKRVGDAVLLFRMGDFYETFYDDAIRCSKALGIALTSRDKNSVNQRQLFAAILRLIDGLRPQLAPT